MTRRNCCAGPGGKVDAPWLSSGPGWDIQEVSRLGAQGVTSKSKLLARDMQPPFAPVTTCLQNALAPRAGKTPRVAEKHTRTSTGVGVVTFIDRPDDRIPTARYLAAGRRDSFTRNVQSGAQNQFRSHECRPLRTFQVEQLQWWGQRPHRDRGGGRPEALFPFPPRLGTFNYQSISETRATSTGTMLGRSRYEVAAWGRCPRRRHDLRPVRLRTGSLVG